MKIDPETSKVTKVGHGGYDDDYIQYYVDNPKAGRCEALRLAGYVGDYVTQEASRIHKRCSERIKQIFSDRIASLDGAAYQQLQHILNSEIKEVGYNNMLSAIDKGMAYSGRKLGDTLTIKQEKTIGDLDSAISDNIKQIAKDEGKEISQVLEELQNPIQH